MTTANPDRGEHELILAGKTYLLRPSFAAIRAIERKTDKSLLTLMRMGNLGELSVDQVGIVGGELIRAGADGADEMTRGASDERIGELAFEQGLPGVVARLTLCLADAATGGRKASGEAKAGAETGPTATGA